MKIQEKAMLANLNISTWSGKLTDKKITQTINEHYETLCFISFFKIINFFHRLFVRRITAYSTYSISGVQDETYGF